MRSFLLLFCLLLSSAAFAQTPPAVPTPDENGVYYFADVMPEFPGGQQAFYKYLVDSTRYPAIEKEAGKQGTVYISFVVQADGSLSNFVAAKDVPGAPGLTKEAIRVLSKMPNWTPGEVNGKPVAVHITQPIKFTLDDGKKKKKKR